MVITPAVIPVATPELEPIVAKVTSLLAHVPATVASVRLVVDPSHTFSVPPIAAGEGLTVTGVVILQPVLMVYVIVAVPAVPPVTTPEASIAAMARLLLLHVPPDDALLRVVVAPGHVVGVPVIDEGSGFTLIVRE